MRVPSFIRPTVCATSKTNSSKFRNYPAPILREYFVDSKFLLPFLVYLQFFRILNSHTEYFLKCWKSLLFIVRGREEGGRQRQRQRERKRERERQRQRESAKDAKQYIHNTTQEFCITRLSGTIITTITGVSFQ